MKDKGEFFFGILILLIIAGFLVLSLRYSPTARLVPVIVAIAGLVFIVLQLMSSIPRLSDKLAFITKKKNFFSTTMIRQKKLAVADEDSLLKNDTLQKVGAISVKEMFFWVILFGVSIFLFGFLTAVPILVCVYLKYRARAGWRFSILSAVGIGFVMYFGFVYLLEVFLYKGYLFILIMGR